MPRRRLPRRVRFMPDVRLFGPIGEPPLGTEELHYDELEAMRLVDLMGMYQEEAAKQMGISRQTLARVLEEGRRKVVRALIRGALIKIVPGNAVLENRVRYNLICLTCGREARTDVDRCDTCGSIRLRKLPGGPELRRRTIGILVREPSLKAEVVNISSAKYIVIPLSDGLSWEAIKLEELKDVKLEALVVSGDEEREEWRGLKLYKFSGELEEALKRWSRAH